MPITTPQPQYWPDPKKVINGLRTPKTDAFITNFLATEREQHHRCPQSLHTNATCQ